MGEVYRNYRKRESDLIPAMTPEEEVEEVIAMKRGEHEIPAKQVISLYDSARVLGHSERDPIGDEPQEEYLTDPQELDPLIGRDSSTVLEVIEDFRIGPDSMPPVNKNY